MSDVGDDKKKKSGVDQFFEESKKNVEKWSDLIFTPILEGGGQVLMPFISAPKPYLPEKEEDDGLKADDAADPKKKKPAALRKEFEVRCKQFREAAFYGTLHLPIEYAGVSNYCNKELFRAEGELVTLKEEFAKKYPTECYNIDSKGRVTVLPVWDIRGKKQVEFQRTMKVPDDMPKGSPEEKKFNAKVARAGKIRFDSKDDKKRHTMEEEIKTYLRRIKDLSSMSTATRSTTQHDSSGVPLPRGLIHRLHRKLAEATVEHPNSMSIATYLIEKEGADINSTNDDGFTALMLAARNGHTETVRHLMTFPSLNMNKVSNSGSNAMHYAAMYAHKDIVQLLKHGVKGGDKAERNKKNDYDRTPRECAEFESAMLREKKIEIWDKTYKQGLYKLVAPLGPKDAPGLFDEMPYKAFGMPHPDSVEVPKEWEAGRWRLSKVPDPACKTDPIPEAQFLERWNSAAKRCGKAKADGKKG